MLRDGRSSIRAVAISFGASRDPSPRSAAWKTTPLDANARRIWSGVDSKHLDLTRGLNALQPRERYQSFVSQCVRTRASRRSAGEHWMITSRLTAPAIRNHG